MFDAWNKETEYHPQSDGMVERFNRTLKTVLRQPLVCSGTSISQVCLGLTGTLHMKRLERSLAISCLGSIADRLQKQHFYPKPHFYLRKLKTTGRRTLLLSSARDLAAKCVQVAQRKYKKQYDKKARTTNLSVRDRVMVLRRQTRPGNCLGPGMVHIEWNEYRQP